MPKRSTPGLGVSDSARDQAAAERIDVEVERGKARVRGSKE